MSAIYTGPTAENLGHIPTDLKTRSQWLLWRGLDRHGKNGEITGLDKRPYTTDPGKLASTTDPQTWTSFQRCVEALPVVLEQWESENPHAYRGGGIGFVFTPEDPYCGIDLDHCYDPDTGTLAPWAQAHVEALSSYTEVTPSRTGLHILVHGTLPPRGRKKGPVEMYSYSRFFTMTGWHVAGTPTTIEARQDALTTVHADVYGVLAKPQERRQPASTPPRLEDIQLLDKARQAANGSKFTALWAGYTSAHNDNDSSADMALCNILTFWTEDAAQIDRLFRQSGLMRPKWDEPRGPQTYGERTIEEALASQREHYTAREPRTPNGTGPLDPTNAPEDTQGTRPVIRLGPDITRMVDEGQAALLALPDGPILFQRARRLSIIARGVKPPRWLHRPADAPVILEVHAAYLEELATQSACWVKWDKRAKKDLEVTPPARFAKTILARPGWLFPVLESIIQSPTLRPDGSILDTPGYDLDTGLYFDSNGTVFPPVPQYPTLDDARTAIGRLQEVVRDFPFAEPWHFSAWLSAVLSLVCRFTIMGCVPMHGITATTRGSGKSLLADTIALIGTGHVAARWPQVLDEDEEKKRLLALALDGDPLVCIDNITAPLGSGALALALTAGSFKDRLLGVNKTQEAPMSAVFLCTGNNMQYVGDVARRVLPIGLDPKVERPEERSGFLHANLLDWLQQERPKLTIAALTIVKAFFVAGCPVQGLTPFGSFQPWSDLIRQALVWSGEADPCEGRKDLEAAGDPEFEVLGTLLHAWHACYDSTRSVTVKQALQDIGVYAKHGTGEPGNEWNDLQDALASCDQKSDGKNLRSEPIGYAIRKWQGRMIDGMRLVKDGESHRVSKWRLKRL